MRLNPLIPNVAWICSWRRVMVMALCSSACVLVGCAAVPSATPYDKVYGNHAAAPAALDQKLAIDAIRQLVALYPPARTRFKITQSTSDAFGMALVAGLREKGYAVMETTADGTAVPTIDAVGGTDTGELALRYLIDQSAAGDLYRLTLAVAQQQLSRAYLVQNGTPYAAGAWVRKE